VPYFLTFTSILTPMINFLPEAIEKEMTSSFYIINFKTVIVIYQKLQRMDFFFTTHTLRSSLFSFCIYTYNNVTVFWVLWSLGFAKNCLVLSLFFGNYRHLNCWTEFFHLCTNHVRSVLAITFLTKEGLKTPKS